MTVFKLNFADKRNLDNACERIIFKINVKLGIFAEHKANIQTINSIMPQGGSALVTITAETMDLVIPLEDLLREFLQLPGVIKAEVLAG